MKPVIFLDRDGTIIKDGVYSNSPAELEVIPEALEALRAFTKEGFTLIIVTNQSGVARGIHTEKDFWNFQDEMIKKLPGVRLAGVYMCPHHPDGSVPQYSKVCDCRKPQPGLLKRAVKELNLNLDGAWMVGDKDIDVQAGQSLGLKTCRIRSDYGYQDGITPTLTVDNLLEFCQKINHTKS